MKELRKRYDAIESELANIFTDKVNALEQDAMFIPADYDAMEDSLDDYLTLIEVRSDITGQVWDIYVVGVTKTGYIIGRDVFEEDDDQEYRFCDIADIIGRMTIIELLEE
jgi:hypothetical protein